MLTPEQLLERKNYIGGSDVAGLLGISPFASPVTVYLAKIGEPVNEPDTSIGSPIDRGNRCEDSLLKAYENETGNNVIKMPTITHPDHDFIRGNIDGWVKDKNILVECKTSQNRKEWGEPDSTQIPKYYLTQVALYAMLTNAQKIDIPVYFFRRNFLSEITRKAKLKGCEITDMDYSTESYEFAIFHYERDEELENIILKKCVDFWVNHVQPKIPPESKDLQDIPWIYPQSTESSITATEAPLRDYYDYIRVQSEIKELEEKSDLIKLRLEKYIGDNDTLITEDDRPIITWKSYERETFNSKDFEKDYPELAVKYKKTSSSRRFTIKKTKES